MMSSYASLNDRAAATADSVKFEDDSKNDSARAQ
jgi:hypothetical protein